jgi:adenine-specific DNA-methyltransferase
MAAITELLRQVTDLALRERLTKEYEILSKNKKFGLVFEEHLPECTSLYGVTIKRGSNVARKLGSVSDIYTVVKIKSDVAFCVRRQTGETEEIRLSDLVVVAKLGEPIFPSLEPIESIENAPDSSLWHTLIEADNYHALQLLEYLYPKQVDCIYIDPPYNTGAKEWKYNDEYVDSSDRWSHSKWLSMMKKRLNIAKRILSEKGVIVISIGYHELHHLVSLCEDMFVDKQVVTVTVQTSGGKPSGGFNYLQEYLVFVASPDFKPNALSFAGGKERTPFEGLTLATFDQTQRPNQTYPIFIDPKTEHIVGCGRSLTERVKAGTYSGELSDFEFDFSEAPEGTVAVWPISSKGGHCVWRLISSRLIDDWKSGYIKVGKNKSAKNPNEYSIQYLPDGIIKKIKRGELQVVGAETDRPTLLFGSNTTVGSDIPTIWTDKRFFTTKGTAQIEDIFGTKEFPYPKPLDLIAEVLRACVDENALIVDFFAGSGTTLHAVNLLNSEDEGNRRCILVTNNEVSEPQSRLLRKQGHQPGDTEWEQSGICRATTWPRTAYSIRGKRADGTILAGEYAPDADGEKRPMSIGFPANVEYFKLGFLDKNAVSLGRQFQEILPILWLKAGAIGKRPSLDGDTVPDMMILPQNRFAILVAETWYPEFISRIEELTDIDTVYFVTNSEAAFRDMSEGVKSGRTYQLYRDYIDNFVLGTRRESL